MTVLEFLNLAGLYGILLVSIMGFVHALSQKPADIRVNPVIVITDEPEEKEKEEQKKQFRILDPGAASSAAEALKEASGK